MRRTAISTIMLLSAFANLLSRTQAQSVQGIDYPRTLSEQTAQPSADAAAMLRYSDCPLSYATGTADISVPLLQWSCGDIDMGLSISYHTGGIKVDDPVGCVGLGWTLQGLGRVSRQICSMPDESRTFISGFMKGYPTADELNDVLFYKKEANLDRYHYDFPGYSGSFVIYGDSIIHLSHNDVRISCSKSVSGIPVGFRITTPDGTVYVFSDSAMENCRQTNKVTEGAYEYYDLSYNAPVVWNLTEIKNNNANSGVGISYDMERGEDKTRESHVPTVSHTWIDGKNVGFSESPVFSPAPPTFKSEYDRRCFPKAVGNNVTIDWQSFISNGKKYKCISDIRLVDDDKKEMRKVHLSYSLFEDGRPRLDSVSVTSGGKLVDSRSFAYYAGYAHTSSDFFGYANGEWLDNAAYMEANIIHHETLELNPYRKSQSSAMQAWSLKSVTEATGITTNFYYSPAVYTFSRRPQLSALTGLVIDRIESVDPVTGRIRIREFKYENPDLSLNLEALTFDDFISLSGVKKYSGNTKIEDEAEYHLSATFTAHSRNAGVPAEKAAVYYGKVTETVSGSNIGTPLKTEYFYDLSHCKHGTPSATYVPGLSYDPTASTGDFSIRLGECIPQTSPQHRYSYEDFIKVFRPKGVTCFDERVDPQPLLIKKISYEYRDNRYVATDTVRNYYSSHRHVSHPVSIYTQSLCYKTIWEGDYDFNLTSESDFDRYKAKVFSDCMLLDSTVTTRCYPDGSKRAVWTLYSYDGIPRSLSSVNACRPYSYTSEKDSLLFDENSIVPVTVVSKFDGSYSGRVTVRAKDVQSETCRPLQRRSMDYSPVTERWFVKNGSQSDSLDLRYDYGFFPSGYILPCRLSLTRNGSDIIASRRLLAYGSARCVDRYTESDGTTVVCDWDYARNTLKSKAIAIGNDLSTLKAVYDALPFVGYTAITNPSGCKHTFTYSGGRLSEERNSAGNTVKSYGYSLYADSGVNMTSETVHGDGRQTTTRTYYDGFGLPVQTAAVGASGDGDGDVSTFTEYDAVDRPVRQWVAFPSSADAPLSSSSAQAAAASFTGDSRPFSAMSYDGSRRSEAAAVYSPGELLADHPARTAYLCNNTTTTELKVRKVTIQGSALSFENLYTAGELDAVKTIDPDGNTLIIFTDWLGYKVLERRIAAPGDYLDTYYINDPWGNPLYVIQPQLSAAYKDRAGHILFSSDEAERYMFVYRYDRCGRVVSKKVPGREAEHYVYDSYGRLAFMQDGNMRADGRAMFTFYDEAGRTVLTGMCDGGNAFASGRTVAPMTAVFDSASDGLCGSGYLVSDLELVQNASLLTAAYYDNYDFLGLDAFAVLPPAGYDRTVCKGLQTGSLTAVLDGSEPIASATFYDSEERPVAVLSSTHLYNTFDITETSYTLDGSPSEVRHTLVKEEDTETGIRTYTDNYTYAYDRCGRLKTVNLAFSEACKRSVNLVTNVYDAVGRLAKATTDGVETAYTYNVRGALKTIFNNLGFNQTLYYEDGDNPLYSGRISAINDRMGRRKFSYDGAGRLLSSVNIMPTPYGTDHYDNEIYSAYYTYDRNSNVLTVNRRGYLDSPKTLAADFIDELSMTYRGNQLVKTADNADAPSLNSSLDFNDGADKDCEYAYDANGNLVSDSNRGISEIRYNDIGRTAFVTFDNGRYLSYLYDAAGKKLRSELFATSSFGPILPIQSILPGEDVSQQPAGTDLAVIPGGGIGGNYPVTKILESRDYLGNYEFLDGGLDRFNTPYGFFDSDGGFFVNVKDYQGNVVASGGEYAAGVSQSDEYYPYGLPTHASNEQKNRYLFGEKEFDLRQGLNVYDFLARTYAPDEARFWQPDPNAGDYTWLSPYTYCGGDPVNFTDPTGMKRYYINMMGELMDREQLNKNNLGDYADELDSNDQIVIVNAEGNVIDKSDLLANNSLHIEVNYSSDKSVKITSIILNGNSIGSNLFEQLATGTKVEWSILQALSRQTYNQENYIGTSHMEKAEYALTFHFEYYIKRETHLVNNAIHSHPSGTEGPSGINDGHNDMAVVKKYSLLYPYARFGIFNPCNGKYIYFNANSNKYDFNHRGGTLPELNVLGSRKK